MGGIGLVLVISYWLQTVASLGSMRRSDNRHASNTLVLAQIVFLLIYLFGMGLGVDLNMHTSTLMI